MGKLAGGGTADALEAVRRALAGVEQASRRRLSGPERLALVTAGLLVAGQLNALVSVLVAEAERARAAEESAGTPLTSWLTLDGRRSAKESAALVFTARDVVANEAVRDAALAGTVSVPQARSIARVLRELPASLTDDQRARAEADLLDRATRTPASGLARATASVLDAVSPTDRESPEGQQARLEAQRHRAFLRRGLTVAADGDGSVLLRGSLPELQAAAFLRVLDAHVEASRRAARDAGGLHDPLASGVGTGVERLDRLHVPPSLAARRVDALMVLVETVMAARTAPSLAGDRPRVVVTMRESDLRRRAEQAGVLTTGAEVSAGDLRRLCCDAELVPAVLGSPSEPLDLGTAVRLVPPGLRAAVALRDGGCVFPGCPVPAERSEAHHIVPWWAGGPTSLANIVLVCPHHHGLLEPPRFGGDARRDRWEVRLSRLDRLPEVLPPARVDPERAPRRTTRHQSPPAPDGCSDHPPRPPTA